MRRILAALLNRTDGRRTGAIPDPLIVFDFTNARVYHEAEEKGLIRDLTRRARDVLQKRVVLTATGTPPPKPAAK